MAKSYVHQLIQRLAEDGRELIESAYENKTFTDRTYNLHDSYGSAVYYNRVLQKDTIYTMTPKAEKARKWYGSKIKGDDEIAMFFEEYEGAGDGLQLIIIAAMPYASILENAEGSVKHKYRVISGAYSDLQDVSRKYKGSTIRRIQTSRK